MARGINEVFLLGHLGNDVRVSTTQSGRTCGRYTLATGRRFKGADGAWKEETAWISCVHWNCDSQAQYLKQGKQVALLGHLVSWVAGEGTDDQHTVVEVNVDELVFTDSRAGAAVAPGEYSPEQIARFNDLNAYEAELVQRAANLELELVRHRQQQQRIPPGEYQRSERGRAIGTFPKREAPAPAAPAAPAPAPPAKKVPAKKR